MPTWNLTNGADNFPIGGAGSPTFWTNTGDDIVNAFDGDDVIDGGAGVDILRGGAGADTYALDNAGDVVDETGGNANEIDRVFSSVAVNLSDASHFIGQIEAVQLLGAGNIGVTGNAVRNYLIGNSGANIIDGGAGADKMWGRGGNDTYIVDDIGDLVDESIYGGSGADLVESSVSFSLSDTAQARGDIENVTLTGSGNIGATGNGLSNNLIGNSGANIIDGGAGADKMWGGAGNDTYIVDNIGDLVDESIHGGRGIDLVKSSVSFNLADPHRVHGIIENVTLTGSAISALGDDFNNILTGNAGANQLDGRGGVDTLRGMGGDDLYVVDNINDFVDERVAGSNGIDTVRSTVSFNLGSQAAGAVENVTLHGELNANAIGNSLDNTLEGNNGNNFIAGGLGNDVLTGGLGNDTFYFNTALNAATNVDRIVNMRGEDTIQLWQPIFTKLDLGILSADAFRIGAAAADADDRIVYNSATGELIYDSNGNAADGSTLFASLDRGLALTAADFYVTF